MLELLQGVMMNKYKYTYQKKVGGCKPFDKNGRNKWVPFQNLGLDIIWMQLNIIWMH